MKFGKYSTLPKAQVTAVPSDDGIYMLRANKYWAITENDEIIFWGDSPQCNSNESIVQQLVDRTTYPGVRVELLPQVWLPCDPHDYC